MSAHGMPGRMGELLRYFQENKEQFGDPEISPIKKAFDLTWEAEHKLALRWSWQDILHIDLRPKYESLIFCSLIWDHKFHLDLKDASHAFLFANAGLESFAGKIEGPFPYTNTILRCRTREGEWLKAAFEAGVDRLEWLG
jgi:hypothetical protein